MNSTVSQFQLSSLIFVYLTKKFVYYLIIFCEHDVYAVSILLGISVLSCLKLDTDYISSKNMQVKNQEGLFFIGEVLDVTGWLGGYNFQWAWSSGWVAGQVV